MTGKSLTPKQREAATALVENDLRDKGEKLTLKELAESLGISDRTFYEWRQKPAFIDYAETICDKTMRSNLAFIDAQLMRLVSGTSNNGTPSVKAIDLAYKRLGKTQNVVKMVDDRDDRPAMTEKEFASRLEALRGSASE